MKKNSGFSLIEMLVALGIVGILSSFITPKVMVYMAKGKDTKAVATLESLRTAAQLYYLDEGESFVSEEDNYGEITVGQLEKLEKYLSTNSKDLVKSDKVVIEIGGSKDSSDSQKIVYGGEMGFTTKDPDAADDDGKNSDGINIWFDKTTDTNIKDYNLNGDKWTEL